MIPMATSCRLPTRYKLPVKEVFCAFLQEGVTPNRDFALRRMTVMKLSDTVDLILKQKGRDIWYLAAVEVPAVAGQTWRIDGHQL